MGYYINPPDKSKEQFLVEFGEPIQASEVKARINECDLPVCLVDNGPFTAAGIAYDEAEADCFLQPDGRPKRWFAVSREALKPYYP